MQPAKLTDQAALPEISFVRDEYARGVRIPWFAKMALKILFAKIPLSYSLWSALGLFRHGDTSRNLGDLHKGFERYYEIFQTHYNRAPKSTLELGPGDSIGHTLSALARGAENSWLIDVGDYATNDETHYKAYYEYLCAQGLIDANAPSPASFSRENVLRYTQSQYGIKGLSDLKAVPSNSIELSYSTAVFEHIRRAEFQDHMNELYRAHKDGSLSCHMVDLHDHLGGALNSMRFSPQFWESHHVQNAGFYTNRLTMDEMVTCAQQAGFSTEIKKIIQWQSMPTAISDMHPSFASKSEQELNICTFLIYLRKAP